MRRWPPTELLRCRPRVVERLDGGRRGVLPREVTDGDRGRLDLPAVLATRLPAEAARPRRRFRDGGPQARRVDSVDRGTACYSWNSWRECSAARERPALADVVDATDRNGSSSPCVGARRTGRARGERRAVRCKDGVASALRILGAATSPEPRDRVVPMSAQRVGLPFTAAAQAAGLKSRVTAHSGRVGLASELTSRGASPT